MDKDFLFPSLDRPPKHPHALVWLLMKGDSYVPGIFTSVYSALGADADLVIMTTPDVSEEAKETLRLLPVIIANISYISFPSAKLKTEKQQKLYEKWVSIAYTKWNMLALPYKRAIFIDGDTIITSWEKNIPKINLLFTLRAPAAPFNNPFVKPLGVIVDYLPKNNRDSDGYLKHSVIIPPDAINKILHHGGMLLTASCVLLEPSIEDFKKYIVFMKEKTSRKPYGYNCHSMVDEQSIADFYINCKKTTFSNIHQVYNYIGWKKGFVHKTLPVILHYFSENKPWNMKFNEYPDVITWYKMLSAGISYTGKNLNEMCERLHINKDNIINADKAQDVFKKDFV